MITPGIPGGGSIVNRLETLYLSGAVKRMHTVPTVGHHDIAGHVYGSLLIGVELCHANKLGPQGVMLALLYHDAAEVDTGDIPAPVKREMPLIKASMDELEKRFDREIGFVQPTLLQIEHDIVKASDTLDLMFKCVVERRMGNRTARLAGVMNNVLNYVKAQKHVVGVSEIVAHLEREWTRY